MVLVVSLQPNKIFKLFSSKLYKIRTRPLDFSSSKYWALYHPSCDSQRGLSGCAKLQMHCRGCTLCRRARTVAGEEACLLVVQQFEFNILKFHVSNFNIFICTISTFWSSNVEPVYKNVELSISKC